MIGFFDTVNRLKPGLVCYAMAIEHYMSDGRDRHDFMVGAGRYKTSFGEPDLRVSSIVRQRPRARLMFSEALRWVSEPVRR